MSKEQKEIQTDENPFGGFDFLNGSVPKEVTKKTKEDKKADLKDSKADNDLSEEELEALNKVAENQKKALEKKSKVEEVESDEDTTTEIEEIEVEDTANEFEGFAKFLADEGLLEIEENDKFESEKDLAKGWKKSIEKEVTNWKQSYPEDAQKFLDFIEQGGRPADFHKHYYGDASFEDFDISTEENQKYVVEESLRLEGYTDEEIADEVNDLIDLGKLEKKATTHLNKLRKVEKENKQMLLEAQKQYAKEQEAIRVKQWDEFKKGLFETESIAGFKFTPKMKQDTWEYMTKVDKKTGKTKYQLDAEESSNSRYMNAYLQMVKWDVKSLEQQVETKTVSKLKAKLANYTDTRQKMSKSPANKIEAEENDNPFAAFKVHLK